MLPQKRLVVQPTANRKTHIMRMVGTFLGVNLATNPLLALTADQVFAFMEGDETYRMIKVHNLDEHAAQLKSFQKKLIEQITGISNTAMLEITLALFMLALTKIRC